ncbi:hypothetical protein [Goekera deserti]|uniref:hypothetical protein n=1 Tax=Goekera deserti TaxID=2497753 RepID=UPI00192E8EA6|nr:hypothetical protein [Goekera deserti]
MIRPAREGDLETLRDVERAAGELFRPLGMTTVADGTAGRAAAGRCSPPPMTGRGRAGWTR